MIAKTNRSVQNHAADFLGRHGLTSKPTTAREIGRFVQLLTSRDQVSPRIAALVRWKLERRFGLTTASRPPANFGTRTCRMCPRTFAAVNAHQLTCSRLCGRAWNNESRRARAAGDLASTRTYATRARDEHRPRPLHGPNAHPYLVAFRRIRAVLDSTPVDQQARVHTEELAHLRAERPDDPRFADMVAWALRENQRKLCECGCGQTARPDNRFVHGHVLKGRAPGWAKRVSA